jgi:polyisoprenoid-binding protein YceI
MKKVQALCCGGLLWAGSLLAAEYPSTAQVKFLGDARLHHFEGTCASKSALIKEAQARYEGIFTVDIHSLNTQKDSRDKEMYHMFEDQKYSTITGSFRNAVLEEGKTLAFKLNIHGVEASYEAALKNVKVDAKAIHFELSFPVSLEKHQLKAPSFMFGAIKVQDIIEVDVEVNGKAS